MTTITIFIIKNWLAIIIVLILILMAIVGYIADSNGFIPKRQKVKKKVSKNKPETIAKPNIDETIQTPVEPPTLSLDNTVQEEPKDTYKKALVIEESDMNQNFEEFEDEFDRILPEKPIISDELKKYMEEFQIKPLNFESKVKEPKISTDIKLPEIEKREEDTDIWSF